MERDLIRTARQMVAAHRKPGTLKRRKIWNIRKRVVHPFALKEDLFLGKEVSAGMHFTWKGPFPRRKYGPLGR